jgi:hypothetical protein
VGCVGILPPTEDRVVLTQRLLHPVAKGRARRERAWHRPCVANMAFLPFRGTHHVMEISVVFFGMEFPSSHRFIRQLSHAPTTLVCDLKIDGGSQTASLPIMLIIVRHVCPWKRRVQAIHWPLRLSFSLMTKRFIFRVSHDRVAVKAGMTSYKK